eukprot:TRINITY_DN7349_c0_g1_i1.p1 TRINITY_DN7349_c0_g1~~TRINITY_DN7349_c0_g1_i1.p1  ORF type:complete len:108 (+),score=14.66 TRINITY_DN7349_c0_g1_i1:151-474(+)
MFTGEDLKLLDELFERNIADQAATQLAEQQFLAEILKTPGFKLENNASTQAYSPESEDVKILIRFFAGSDAPTAHSKPKILRDSLEKGPITKLSHTGRSFGENHRSQ